MVFLSTKYLQTLPIVGRLITIIFSIVSIGIGGHAYQSSTYNMIWRVEQSLPQPLYINMSNSPDLQSETFFVIAIALLLILSVISLLCNILNEEMRQDKLIKQIDIGIHVIGAVLQITAGSLMIVSANRIANNCKPLSAVIKNSDLICQHEGEKICAGVFAILNSFAYGFVVYLGVRYYKRNRAEVQESTSTRQSAKP